MTAKGWRAIKKMGSDMAVKQVKTIRKIEQEGGDAFQRLHRELGQLDKGRLLVLVHVKSVKSGQIVGRRAHQSVLCLTNDQGNLLLHKVKVEKQGKDYTIDLRASWALEEVRTVDAIDADKSTKMFSLEFER
eukprot:gene23069-21609_t